MKKIVYERNNRHSEYGTVGDITFMTYKNGDFMQVGDLVKSTNISDGNNELHFIVKDDDCSFVMGYKHDYVINGKSIDFKIELIKKYYDVEVNEKCGCLQLIEVGVGSILNNKLLTQEDVEIDIASDDISKELIVEIIQYIKKVVVTNDNNFGYGRNFKKILKEDGDIPKIYFKLAELLIK